MAKSFSKVINNCAHCPNLTKKKIGVSHYDGWDYYCNALKNWAYFVEPGKEGYDWDPDCDYLDPEDKITEPIDYRCPLPDCNPKPY